MRTVEIIRDEILHSNDTFETNEVLDIIDEIVGLKNEQIENLARIIETQEKRHNKEKERVVQALEEKIKFSHVSVSGGRANGKSINYGYKVGLCDALKSVKAGGENGNR